MLTCFNRVKAYRAPPDSRELDLSGCAELGGLLWLKEHEGMESVIIFASLFTAWQYM